MFRNDDVEISVLKGRVIKDIDVNKDKDVITFNMEDGHIYKMLHFQNCCEDVRIEDIEGDLGNLVGSPIVSAEESSNEGNKGNDNYGTETWTFYKFSTIKGYVTIRWYGESNGYYSEEVDFVDVTNQ